MHEFSGFTPDLYSFLKDLKASNSREWFTANKERYTRYLKEPTLAFIAAMGPRLETISQSFIADPRANGGSMFRIFRDTRFSKDKTPYKTNVGCQFRHSAGRDAHAPGFYVHMSPGQNFAGGGIWTPPPFVLEKIRNAILDNEPEWAQVRDILGRSGVTLMDAERYKRPPAGVPADHRFIDDLSMKSFYASRSFTDSEVTSPDFLERVTQTFADVSPLMRFVSEALDLSF